MKTKFLILGTLFVNSVMFAEKDSEMIPELVRLEFADLFPAGVASAKWTKDGSVYAAEYAENFKNIKVFLNKDGIVEEIDRELSEEEIQNSSLLERINFTHDEKIEHVTCVDDLSGEVYYLINYFTKDGVYKTLELYTENNQEYVQNQGVVLF